MKLPRISVPDLARLRGIAVGLWRGAAGRVRALLVLVAAIAGLSIALIIVVRGQAAAVTDQVQSELEWRALRGARELGTAAELDAGRFAEALRAYLESDDVLAVGLKVGRDLYMTEDRAEDMWPLFRNDAGALVPGKDFVASWAAVRPPNGETAKLAVLVSTARLDAARANGSRSTWIVAIAGAIAAVVSSFGVLRLARGGGGGGSVVSSAGTVIALPGGGDAPSAPTAEDEDAAEERERDQRTLRTILSFASQGIVAIDIAGRIVGDRTLALERWFGRPEPDATLADYLSVHSFEVSRGIEAGLASIAEGVPVEEAIARFPKRLTFNERAWELTYTPVTMDDRPIRIVVAISDISEQAARERAAEEALVEAERKEIATLAQMAASDRPSFDEFFSEAAGLVAALQSPGEPALEARTLRTLKEHCAYHGLDSFVAVCRELEDAFDEETGITDAQRTTLTTAWGRVAGMLAASMNG